MTSANDNFDPERPFAATAHPDELGELLDFLEMIQEGHPEIAGNGRWRQLLYDLSLEYVGRSAGE